MNKLFKATALASIAVASVIIASCSGSDGKNGPNGPDGAAGVSCSIDDKLDFYCGGEKVGSLISPQGPQGAIGTPGTGCDLQAAGEGAWNVVCDGELKGTIREGQDSNSAGFNCNLVPAGTDSLVITCGSVRYVMSLCNGETFNENRHFCAESAGGTRECNNGDYDFVKDEWKDYAEDFCTEGALCAAGDFVEGVWGGKCNFSLNLSLGCSAANWDGSTWAPGCASNAGKQCIQDDVDAGTEGCFAGVACKMEHWDGTNWTGACGTSGNIILACKAADYNDDGTWDRDCDIPANKALECTETDYEGAGAWNDGCDIPANKALECTASNFSESTGDFDDTNCDGEVLHCLNSASGDEEAGGTGLCENNADDTYFLVDGTVTGLLDASVVGGLKNTGVVTGFPDGTLDADLDGNTGVTGVKGALSGVPTSNAASIKGFRTITGEVTTPGGERAKTPLCNGSTYDIDKQHCARNLIIGVARSYVGSTSVLETIYSDIDSSNTNSNNWMVLGKKSGTTSVDTCFAQAAGVTSYSNALIIPCSVAGASLAGGFELTIADYQKAPNETLRKTKNISFACAQGTFFSFTEGKCVAAVATQAVGTGCDVIMNNINACYLRDTLDVHNIENAEERATFQRPSMFGTGTDKIGPIRAIPAAPVANTNVFARKCQLGDVAQARFYDTKTVSSCDENRYNYELAIKCASGLYSSKVQNVIFDGSDYAKRYICVSASNPTSCPVGSSNVGGICSISGTAKTPVCPAGYVRGSAPTDPEDIVDPRNYCVKDVDQAMCDSIVSSATNKKLVGLLKPGAGEDLGSCVIAPAGEVVAAQTGYTKDDATDRYVYTPATGAAGICLNGYKYNATTHLCELSTKDPKCYAGYNRVKTTIGNAENYYCVYVPKLSDCPPYHTLNDEYKKCLPPGVEGLAELKTPSCPYGNVNTDIKFDADAKVCFEPLGEKHCPVGSGLDMNTEDDDLPHDCIIEGGSEITCPGKDSNFDEGICSIAYDALCVDPFVYNSTTKKCEIGMGSLEPNCPFVNPLERGILDSELKKCRVEISADHCPLNIENPDWTWVADAKNVPVFYEKDGKTLLSSVSRPSATLSFYLTNDDEGNRVQECRFTPGVIPGVTFGLASTALSYNSPMCDAKGTPPKSDIGRCEK